MILNKEFSVFSRRFSREKCPTITLTSFLQFTLNGPFFSSFVQLFSRDILVRMQRFQRSDITFSKFGYTVFKVRIYCFQSSDIPFSKFGYTVFKVRIYRFQSSDITFSFFPNFFDDPQSFT